MPDITAIREMVQAINDYSAKNPELGSVLVKITSAVDSLNRRITNLENRPSAPGGKPPLARR